MPLLELINKSNEQNIHIKNQYFQMTNCNLFFFLIQSKYYYLNYWHPSKDKCIIFNSFENYIIKQLL